MIHCVGGNNGGGDPRRKAVESPEIVRIEIKGLGTSPGDNLEE
jgi:hypothetical protein